MRDDETLRVRREKFLFQIDLAADETATNDHGFLRTRDEENEREPDDSNRFDTPLWLERHLRRHGVQLDRFFWYFELKQNREWRIVNMFSGNEYVMRRQSDQGDRLDIYHKRRGRFRILALDGGGLAGLFTARVLQKTQVKLKDRIAEEFLRRAAQLREMRDNKDTLEKVQTVFPAFEENYLMGLDQNFLQNVDHILGTSAGAVNAIVLAQYDDPTEGLSKLVKLWREPKLFSNPMGFWLARFGFAPYMSSTIFRAVLSKYIDPGLKLKDLKKDVLITSFALDPPGPGPRWAPKNFNSRDPEDEDESALDVAMRACSAPVLAPLHQGYVDGGVFSPSPTTHAISLFRSMMRENDLERKQLEELYKKALMAKSGAAGTVTAYIKEIYALPGISGLDDKWENWNENRAAEFVSQHLQRSQSTLQLLSIGTGTRNKRMILSDQKDYQWGIWQWSIPSPLNSFLNGNAMLLSANDDRAAIDMEHLSGASPDLKFRRISPGTLTFDQFAYTYGATNPFFRPGLIWLLEQDVNKLAVDQEVDATIDWLMREWVGESSLLGRLQQEGSTISLKSPEGRKLDDLETRVERLETSSTLGA